MKKPLHCLIFFLLTLALTGSALAGMSISHWLAPSGARVVFVETHNLPILDVQLDFAAGGVYAPAHLSGVAGLTHGLLDTGAGDLDEEMIAARLVDTGAQMSGSVDVDRASIRLRTLSSAREQDAALGLLHQVISAPNFPESVLEREKSRSIAALKDALTRPDAIAARRFSALIYPDHPYGIQPDEESVARITRADLQAFYRARYQARFASVAIIGDLTRAQAEHIAQRLTADLPTGDAVEAPLPAVTLPQARTEHIAHPATQSHILIGLPAITRADPDYVALQVGNYSLGGGGFNSRLMQEVREKRGLTYGVSSHFSPRQLAGPFQISLQTRRDQSQEALKVVNAVLDTFLHDGPDERELNEAKKYLVDSLALGLDSNAKQLGYLSLIGFYRLPLSYLDDFPGRVAAVTRAQVVAAFARRVDPAHRVTVVVAGEE